MDSFINNSKLKVPQLTIPCNDPKPDSPIDRRIISCSTKLLGARVTNMTPRSPNNKALAIARILQLTSNSTLHTFDKL